MYFLGICLPPSASVISCPIASPVRASGSPAQPYPWWIIWSPWLFFRPVVLFATLVSLQNNSHQWYRSSAQPDYRDPTYASEHVSVEMLSSPSAHRHEFDSKTSDKWLALRSFICNLDPSRCIYNSGPCRLAVSKTSPFSEDNCKSLPHLYSHNKVIYRNT